MKVSTVMRTIKIDNATLLNLFVYAVYGDAKASTGKDRTLYRAFSRLVGISDVEAVRMANRYAKKEDRITTDKFRRWLPTVFSEFARVMLEVAE